MARLLGAAIIALKLGEWLMPLIPTPRQVGPYEDPIGGGMWAEPRLEPKYQCTLLDPEDCGDA